MATTALGLMFKTIASDLISGRFTFNKQGYDFCILTMGASLSSFAMQLTSNIDLFPGIGTLTGFSPSTTADVLTQRRVILFLVFLVSTAMSFLTAYISRLIRESEETDDQLKKVKAPQALSLLNYLLGMGLFGAYLLILITKG
jgi:small-conductance mechanosensitive channel